jgi:curved DNA-binding protein CbpA
VLRVGFDATEAAIRKAYKAAALRWHPDKNPANFEEAAGMFKDIQEAFAVLSDANLRREYDSLGEKELRQSRASHSSGGEESFSDTPGSSQKINYKPFFGASFGTAPDFGYSRDVSSPVNSSFEHDSAAAAQPANVTDAIIGEMLGPISQGRSGTLREGTAKGGTNRFAGWTYDKDKNPYQAKGTSVSLDPPVFIDNPTGSNQASKSSAARSSNSKTSGTFKGAYQK